MLVDAGGDVNAISTDGSETSVLDSAIMGCAGHVPSAPNQLSRDDNTPSRSLVILLACARITTATLEHAIAQCKRNKSMAKSGRGAHLSHRQNYGPRFALPVLEAQAKGERRWCMHCHSIERLKNLSMCSACQQVGSETARGVFCGEREQSETLGVCGTT